MPTKVIDKINVDGQDYVIEMETTTVPTDGSTLPVQSGGVWPYTNDRGDTAKENSTGIFTREGAYRYFLGATDPDKWLSWVFGHAFGRYIDNFAYVSVGSTSPGTYKIRIGGTNNSEMVVCGSNGIDIFDISQTVPVWLRHINFNGNACYDAAYGSNKWVAVTFDGVYYGTSSNSSWTKINSISYNAYHQAFSHPTYGGYAGKPKSILFANNMFVVGICAAATGSTTATTSFLYWSTNGTSWTQCTTPWNGTQLTSSSRCVTDIAYSGGKWVATTAIETSSPSGAIVTSSDGKTWTRPGTYEGLYAHIAYGNGVYLIGKEHLFSGQSTLTCGAYTTTDFTSLTQLSDITFDRGVTMVKFENGLFFMSTQSELWWSADASTWTKATIPYSVSMVRDVIYANGVWICTNSGTVSSTSPHSVWWSLDGKNWYDSTICSQNAAIGMARVNGSFFFTSNSAYVCRSGINELIAHGYFA